MKHPIPPPVKFKLPVPNNTLKGKLKPLRDIPFTDLPDNTKKYRSIC